MFDTITRFKLREVLAASTRQAQAAHDVRAYILSLIIKSCTGYLVFPHAVTLGDRNHPSMLGLRTAYFVGAGYSYAGPSLFLAVDHVILCCMQSTSVQQGPSPGGYATAPPVPRLCGYMIQRTKELSESYQCCLLPVLSPHCCSAGAALLQPLCIPCRISG